MIKRKILIATVIITLFSACASYTNKVVQRMDDVDARPEWATLSKTTYLKDGNFYAIGYTEGPGTANIPALLRVADNNARVELAKIVSNDISSIFQNVQEGIDDNDLVRSISSESTKIVSQEIIPDKRYWEKVVINDDGEDEVKLNVYSLIYIKQGKIKKLIKQSLQKNKEISQELLLKVNNQLDHLMENK